MLSASRCLLVKPLIFVHYPLRKKSTIVNHGRPWLTMLSGMKSTLSLYHANNSQINVSHLYYVNFCLFRNFTCILYTGFCLLRCMVFAQKIRKETLIPE